MQVLANDFEFNEYVRFMKPYRVGFSLQMSQARRIKGLQAELAAAQDKIKKHATAAAAAAEL